MGIDDHFSSTRFASRSCLEATDINANGGVDLTDAVHLLNHLFLGGPPPEAPFPECENTNTKVVKYNASGATHSSGNAAMSVVR